MEVVITIALLIVPVISIVSLALAIRVSSKQKALKQLVMEFSKMINASAQTDPVERALSAYRINES